MTGKLPYIHGLTRILGLTALSVLLYTVPLHAQTCRVRISVDAAGGRVEYREVYEYDYVWEKPSFPGGDDKLLSFINKNRHYPEAAYKAGIQGRVVCSFIVNSNGSVSDIQVFKGIEASLNEEALRIFSLMPKWNPGRINGVAV